MLLLQPLVAYPAPSPITPTLAESPLNSQNPVKPNVMFTMDDSGSMANYYLPDYVGETSGMCRDGSACGKATNTSFPTQMDPPIASFQFNHLYYNPGETYSVGQREDRADLIYDKSGGAWTQVLTDPFNKYPAASTSAATNLAPTSGTPTKALSTATDRYPDTIWCIKSTNSSADWATADTDGSVCRRNGRKYLAGGSGANKTLAIEAGYNYPNSSNPPPGSCPSNTKCQFTNGYMVYGYPYYYNISSVQFCSGKDANGWGASGCVAKWDSSATPPHKYVSYGGGFNATAFTRVDITPSGFVRNGAPPVAINSDNGRTYAQEMANFATWYAFSRTRLNALKTAGGIGFAALELDPAHIHTRIGFNTLNSYQSKWLPIQEFSPLNRSSWFNNFYSVQPSSTTPSVDAMWRVGEYFSNRGTTAGLTSTQAADPLDKDTGKCQPNFHLLSTDGYWNQTVGSYTGLAGSIGNSDATPVPTLPVANTGTGFTPGQPFPLPYHEGSGTNSMSNGMADVAMYYWIHDLRPLLADKGKDSIAPWQHVTFYGLSIGAEGTIPYAPNPPAGVVWPKPASLTPAAIDDLWHAAVNSRGKYFDAQTSRELGESIVNSLSDFTDQEGTGTGVGLAGAQLSVTNQYAYMTRYQIGIWGDVKKYKLDIDTGILPVDADGHPLNAAIWSAATQLDAQAAVIGSVNGWDTNRKIITRNDVSKAVVPFRLDSLSATQQSSLNAGWYGVLPQPTSQSVLNFLRGDQSLEGVDTTSFRTRSHILGDVVYSGAVPVGPPNLPYIDAGNPGYEKFVNDNASRAAAVYVGANDGMVHAFDDTATNGGKETWAYIPMALFSGGDPNDSAHAPSAAFQIGSLTYRRGGIPLFAHKFFVNATPRAWDVDFGNTNVSNASGPPSSGNDWRTVLIGGLGAGGRAVYALDVTNPVALSDTEASIAKSGRALWEFTAPDLGYVFDQPTLVKTYAYGWVVLVASGYNNPGGKGYLYVLNPRNGVEPPEAGTER